MTLISSRPTDTRGTPRVSVMVPLYNAVHVIDETIDSLLAQTLDDVEYILIDDGSTDGTYESVRDRASNNPAFTVIQQPNQGPSAARNHALRLARGDYLFFLDGDDVLPPDALALLYAAAVEQEADLVLGQMVRWDGSRTWPIEQYVKHGVYHPGRTQITEHPGLLWAMGPTAKLYRRACVEGVFFPEDMRLGEDQPFVLQAYLAADVIYVIDSIVYYYRTSAPETPSLTAKAMQDPVERFGDLVQMVNLAWQQLQNHPDLFAYYLNRVMLADMLPRFRAAMYTRDAATQRAIVDMLSAFLHDVDDQLFHTVPSLKSQLRLNLLLCRRSVQPDAADLYREFTQFVRNRTPFSANLEAVPVLAAAIIRRLKRLVSPGSGGPRP